MENNNKMNDAQVAVVMGTDAFKKSASVIARELRILRQDAEVLLIENIWEHRGVLSSTTDTVTDQGLAHINFAKKDVLRADHKYENATMKLFQPDTDTGGKSLIENVATLEDNTVSYSPEEVERAILATSLVLTKNQAEFIEDVLTKGAESVNENHGWTNAVFNQRMKRIEATLGEKQDKLSGVLKSDAQIRHEKNLLKAQSIIDMVNTDSTPMAWIQKALTDSMDDVFFDICWDNVKHPRAMVRDWDATPSARQDGYKFMTALEELIEG